jgi:two-component system, LytTR family, response regulator
MNTSPPNPRSMLRVMIIEDEKHSRETLRNLLTEFVEDITIVAMSGDVHEAIALAQQTRPEVLFLDVELQTGTGFDVLEGIKNLDVEVIFTTAFEQYAIKAIKFSSIDYLLKPIDIEELQAAVTKVRNRQNKEGYSRQLELLLNQTKSLGHEKSRICLATLDSIEFIDLHDILFCEANGSYTNFHLSENRKLMVSKHLKEYEQLLADHDFMRVHNSYLINLNKVKKYIKTEGGYILMENDAQITLSPKKRDDFFSRMARS